jgi:hypothetical protein
VKNIINAIRDLQPPTVLPASNPGVFAVADTERLRYYLWYPEVAGSTTSTRALVYNAKTDTWTERDDDTSGGYAGPGGLLYLGNPSAATVTEQRHTGTASDFKGPSNEALHVEIEWAKLTNGNPAGDSQFTELRLLTEEPTTGDYVCTLTNHYGESESCTAEGEGLPLVRIPVPDGVQRTSRLSVNVKRDVLEEYLVILGLGDAADGYNGPPSKG